MNHRCLHDFSMGTHEEKILYNSWLDSKHFKLGTRSLIKRPKLWLETISRNSFCLSLVAVAINMREEGTKLTAKKQVNKTN